jgi:RIO-like serine/threonine protein kinase
MYLAHNAAFFVAGVLHRDISVGNVILTAEGRGLLIDWDLCIRVANMKNPARRPDRTVSFQFILR